MPQSIIKRDRVAASRVRAAFASRLRALVAPVLLAALASCATYNDRTAAALKDFERGQFAAAERAYADESTTKSAFLAGAEAGTVALTAGEWTAARAHLEKAASEVLEIEERALVSAEALGEDVLALALNESWQKYPGEGFERVMLHAALAITYLAEGQPDGAYVEARRANALLEREEELYEKKYAAGGLGHFLSALAYELLGEPGEAYIDYKRMVEKEIGVELAGKALVRLAEDLGFDDELATWRERFGDAAPRADGLASIVVIAGVGLGPYKQESGFTLPIKGRVVQFAVPTHATRTQPVDALLLSVTGVPGAVATHVIEDVARVAKENLDDRIAMLAAKSALRAGIKYELTRRLEKEHGLAGLLVGDVFAVATERADLRAWQTLPDTWQAARAFVETGEHEITLEARGGERLVLGRFQLERGETMLVFARTLGTRLYAHSIGGRRLDVPVADVARPPTESPQTSATETQP